MPGKSNSRHRSHLPNRNTLQTSFRSVGMALAPAIRKVADQRSRQVNGNRPKEHLLLLIRQAHEEICNATRISPRQQFDRGVPVIL